MGSSLLLINACRGGGDREGLHWTAGRGPTCPTLPLTATAVDPSGCVCLVCATSLAWLGPRADALYDRPRDEAAGTTGSSPGYKRALRMHEDHKHAGAGWGTDSSPGATDRAGPAPGKARQRQRRKQRQPERQWRR